MGGRIPCWAVRLVMPNHFYYDGGGDRYFPLTYGLLADNGKHLPDAFGGEVGIEMGFVSEINLIGDKSPESVGFNTDKLIFIIHYGRVFK